LKHGEQAGATAILMIDNTAKVNSTLVGIGGYDFIMPNTLPAYMLSKEEGAMFMAAFNADPQTTVTFRLEDKSEATAAFAKSFAAPEPTTAPPSGAAGVTAGAAVMAILASLL
jgi:hypothetical protein